MKTLFYTICCVGLLWPSGLRAAEADESMNRFVSSLLKKMTLEEKIAKKLMVTSYHLEIRSST